MNQPHAFEQILRYTKQNGNTRIESNGELRLKLSSIKSIGIRHLAEVEEYRINTIAGSRSHWVRFINGGILAFAYNANGQLLEFSAENLEVNCIHGDTLNFFIPA